MIIYIVERDNPYNTPEPQVFVCGNSALETVRNEYEAQLKELGITKEMIKNDEADYGCYWCFENGCSVGSALIDYDWDGDRWTWRITEHTIG